MRAQIIRLVESSRFEKFIIAIITVNAVILGLETSPSIMARFGGILVAMDKAAIGIFVIEIVLKLFAYRLRFFTSGWNLFDLAIVGIALA